MSDATSRNALYKIHINLGKLVNALDEQPTQRRTSRSVSVLTDRQSPEEDKILISEPRIKEEDEESDDTVMPKEERQSSLMEELLSDDEDTEMTDI